MGEGEELRIRYLFFEYFCQLLRHFEMGINHAPERIDRTSQPNSSKKKSK